MHLLACLLDYLLTYFRVTILSHSGCLPKHRRYTFIVQVLRLHPGQHFFCATTCLAVSQVDVIGQ